MVLLTSAMNLIDGMDGLVTGVSLFAALTMVTSALLVGNVPLAGALLGFFRVKFNPATIFLCDFSSLLIGFLLGCFGLFGKQKSATLLGVKSPLLALVDPLLGVLSAIVCRFVKRQSIFLSERGHIHHRLLDPGLTVLQA